MITRVYKRFSESHVATLILGDCTKTLQKIPACSVDLIVSSPPYCIGKSYDSSINTDSFVDQHRIIAPILTRLLKPGGSLCWQTGYHTNGKGLTPLDFLAHGEFSQQHELRLQNRIIWVYGHGPHCRKRFSGRHETVLWYSKGEPTFDLDPVRVPQKYPGKRHYKGDKKGELSGNPLGKNPSDVWEIPNVKSSHIEKTDHPCQFPVALVQRLIRGLCPEQGLVLDPFSGTSTTGVAAIVEGRRYLGVERDETYYRLGKNRVLEAMNGKAKYRDIDKPIEQPVLTQAVARKPKHFI
jgi:adenine-specific DNA-methyltransferase